MQCHYDFVRVIDGDSISNGRMLAQLCGDHSNSPPILESTGNKMLVQFQSDHSQNYPGFTAAVIFKTGELIDFA
jgi:hypothetical protein